jgi:hypothetical protein
VEKYEYYSSETNAGGRVRPSNWMSRVAQLSSIFDKRKRLIYSDALLPVVRDNNICLRVNEEKLKTEFPGIYESVIAILIFLDAKRLD